MASPTTAPHHLSTLLQRLADARARTDQLFAMLKAEALCDRPIAERHRVVFYLGHLEAFDWNLLGRGALGLQSTHAEFDKLFSFGIDPTNGDLPDDQPADWPSVSEIRKYNQVVRERIDGGLRGFSWTDPAPSLLGDGTLLHVAIEHRLMHAETLAYMFHQLPIVRKHPQPVPRATAAAPVAPRMVTIPGGMATLGQPRNGGESFGWDNEFESCHVAVPAFAIDAYPVTNAQFLEFVRAGGYEDQSLWSADDWKWKTAAGISHPNFWVRRGDQWDYRAMFAQISMPLDSPVYVSHAEAAAFARWAGKSLPTEAQWHRAAYGTPQGGERSYPWGEQLPDERRGNFDFRRWDPAPVSAHPAGASAFGVFDLVGNGWEWTSTPFAPLPGFQAFPFYSGYSANFFDGRHYVMKGGSARTAACMLRRPFRNWFQPHYPFVYATFRCVEA